MKTLDLKRKRNITLDELLRLATTGVVRVLTADGRAFVVEEADEFDYEVQMLAQSRKFARFLKARSREPATKSLQQYRSSLG
jgi:hypothetical protein